GLYFQAVADAMDFPEHEEAQTVRAALQAQAEQDPAGLYRRLQEVDPESAAAIPEGNVRRIIRALEVRELTGEPYSRFQGRLFEGKGANDIVAAGIEAERELLAALIHRRVEAMMERGLVDEVRALAAEGCLSRTARQALGYRQILEFLDTPSGLEETIAKIELGTRRLAKRQLTWFRRDPRIVWFKLDGAGDGDLRRLEEHVP
ncbi:MAG: tRNA (adenosine(37)-N6)-dimethylallyltransferase MiaA, partial [Actinobacteria bacterium]|nr:tRNA (adenosine(37)-N6)-dimethylallyltransferase MiaA [Actinomycetota bacterium]